MTLFLFLACGHNAEVATDVAAQAPVEVAVEAAAVRDIDVATLKADSEAGSVPVLVDVRTVDEFAEGHVPGAVNIPMDQLSKRAGELDKSQDVYLICRSGGRSARAAGQLAELGFSPVNVEGGTLAWIEAGHAVE
jgi:rhodanese-related sulfurtransferase